MISINIYVKLAIIALGIIGGAALSFFYGFWYGFPFILIGLAMLVSYFLLGTIQSAGKLIQEEKFEQASKQLNMTKFPKLLYSTNRAYYYMLNGSIQQARGQHDKAQDFFKEASHVKVSTDNEKAMLELQFAAQAIRKQNFSAAKKHMKIINDLNITMPELTAQIAQFEQALKQSGQMRGAMRQGGGRNVIRPGGKRRRPRAR